VRIANYSGGNLRHANALCDRAVRTGQSSSRKQISTEIVDGAAKDLGLWQPRWVRKEDAQKMSAPSPATFSPQKPFATPPEQIATTHGHGESFRFQFIDDDSAAAVDKEFFGYKDDDHRRRGGGNRFLIGSLVVLSLVAVAGLWLNGNGLKQAIGAWGSKLQDIAEFAKPPSPALETAPKIPPETPVVPASPLPSPETVPPPSASLDLPQDNPTPSVKIEEPPPPALPSPEPLPVKPPAETKKAQPLTLSRAREETPRNLAAEVVKAIQNRAIEGVQVSVKNNIVYLEGRVASERQRHAAELAAAGVPGVHGVRNRIGVQ
jgi:hypothetical protein